MASEERALNLMEWLNTDDEEYIATLDKIKDMFDQHAAEHDQWISTTDRQPPSLESGQYKKYLVSCNGQVFECSWLFGGWHKHHDGCSECHPDAWQYMPTPYQEKEDEFS